MKWQPILLRLGLITGVMTFNNNGPPGCVAKCWNNSKYVTSCGQVNEMQCLCDDAGFQNVVLQCLHSQCQTAQFGSALHYALEQCSATTGPNVIKVLPPLLRRQGQRKNGDPNTEHESGHVSASAIHSLARRSVGVSASANARVTRSARQTPTSMHKTAMISSVALASLSNTTNSVLTSVPIG